MFPTLCDLGRAVAGLDEDVSALGTESGGDGSGESVDTVQESLSALDTELELLRSWSANRLGVGVDTMCYLVRESLLLQRDRTELRGGKGSSPGTGRKSALHCRGYI